MSLFVFYSVGSMRPPTRASTLYAWICLLPVAIRWTSGCILTYTNVLCFYFLNVRSKSSTAICIFHTHFCHDCRSFASDCVFNEDTLFCSSIRSILFLAPLFARFACLSKFTITCLLLFIFCIESFFFSLKFSSQSFSLYVHYHVHWKPVVFLNC